GRGEPGGHITAKYCGALLGGAVGDGLGAPFEGHAGPVPLRRLAVVEREPVGLRHTDDTAMTIALAESLLEVGDVDEDHLAATLARRWKREPGRGYASGAATLFSRLGAGEARQDVAPSLFGGDGSLGNGAAMRVAPVALLAGGDPHTAAWLGRRTARVTHTHPLGIDGAAVQAAAVAIALGQQPSERVDAEQFIGILTAEAHEPELVLKLHTVLDLLRCSNPRVVASRLGAGVTAPEAVAAAIWSFLRHAGSYRAVVRGAIRLGGDTDTVASMAGALAGAHLGEHAIPASWRHRAEAADELLALALRFVALAPGPTAG
ncbi:MAG: hypothetical protein GEV08_16820, partial [Acidimicrobiia bacterium]|nr:hypothetical protein [Acidimicrobiia bacterium]